MKLIINIILISGLSYLSATLGWWEWDFAIIAFLLAFFINANGWSSFFSGLLAIGGLWLVMAYLANQGNEGVLAGRIAEIFSLPTGESLILLAGLVGGMVGGFSALTGSLTRLMIDPPLKNLRRKNTWRKW